MKKFILILLFVITALILCLIIYGYSVLKLSIPDNEGKIQISSLQDSVEITYDKMGIPQIWANNEADAYFTIGYLHASDRLFQMDMTRRVAHGRLSELLGPSTLEIDIQQRTIGHTRIAHSYLDKLSDENRSKLNAYRNGVNTYVQECSALPFEYQLLVVDFEEWKIIDCLTILSFQTWFSDFLMSPDQFFVKLAEKVGLDKAKPINVSYPDWAPTVVPSNENKTTLKSIIQSTIAENLVANQTLPFLMSNSSNSWVVAPQRSKSGSAMLASDPHLEIQRLPQFWHYLGAHIKDKGIDALGIMAPGVPVLIMGHNTKAAWAFTVSGVDVSEYYIEKINPDDSTQYLTPQGWQSFDTFEEFIKVSGQDDPVVVNVRESRHGPIVFSNDSLRQIYAQHWTGFDVDLNEAVTAGLFMIEMDNFEDFRRTVTKLGALDASWTYADAKGNIGYQLGTPVAKRPKSNNNFPVPGWTDEYEWQGFYSLDEVPFSYNPAKGWLATCNNKADQQNLDYELEGFFAFDRILRINELLESKDIFSFEDMQKFQMDITDRYLTRWSRLLHPYLLELGNVDWIQKLNTWDGYSGIDSKETAFVNVFIYYVKHLLFDYELGELSNKISSLTVEAVLIASESNWFDNIKTEEKIETKEDIIKQAIEKTLKKIENKTWGDLHTLNMQHPLSIVPVIGSLLDLSFGPMPWAGTVGTLNVSLFIDEKNNPGHFQSFVAPSWRFVIDFADIDGATIVLPTGNSGNPMSPHFMDFFEMWKTGERWSVPSCYEKVKARATNTLILSPKNKF